MTALSSNVNRPNVAGPNYTDDDVAAGVLIYAGALCSLDTSGNARPGRATATDEVRGVCKVEVNNTGGSAGDVKVRLHKGVFVFENSAGGDEITKADFESTCYIVDDNTVAKTSNGGTRPAAGRVVRLEGTKVAVEIGQTMAADGDLASANDLSDVNDAATARDNIGANIQLLNVRVPLDAAGVFYLPLPDACTVLSILTAVEGATTANGNATITAALDTVDITDGVVTIASGSVVGTKDSATPSAANVATAGQNLRLTVAPNSQDAAAFANVTAKIKN